MRTTLNLDPVILTAAKEVAAETQCSVGDVISDWANRGLRSRSHIGVPLRKSPERRTKFPAFELPPESPPITSQRVRDLINREGI